MTTQIHRPVLCSTLPPTPRSLAAPPHDRAAGSAGPDRGAWAAIRGAWAVAAVAAVAAATPACVAASDPVDDTTGTVVIPLQQVGTDGALYQLSATFGVASASGIQLLDATGTAPSVTTTVPSGPTTISLESGWSLQRSTDGGTTFAPVVALLGSANPVELTIAGPQPVTVAFSFLMRTPSGNLTISFSLDPAPRKLVGEVIAGNFVTGDYAAYANRRFGFVIYYSLASVDSTVHPNGAHQRVFRAGPAAIEVTDDPFGPIAFSVAPALAAGVGGYNIFVHPDGTQELLAATLLRGPHAVLMGGTPLVPGVPLDADGFPTDGAFALQTDFELLTRSPIGDSELHGIVNLVSLPGTP